MLQTLNQGQGSLPPEPLRPEQAGFAFAGFEVGGRLRDWLWQRGGKFGLDRFKSRLQALVDGHELETLNPFASQYEGGKMKGIQCSQ